MSRCVYFGVRTAAAVLMAITSAFFAPAAHAQTTVVLDAPDSEVVDTYVRGGSYASTNFDKKELVTRASTDTTHIRRALLKFNTETYVPKGATIKSATLTLTVRGGNSQTRTLSAYRISESFDEYAATWRDRKRGIDWQASGGAYGSRYATATATGTPGSKVSFNVTSLVQETVNGKYGSRYTRVAVLDQGSSTSESYREFYPSEATDASVRPRLTVVYGSSTSTSTSGSTSGSTTSGSTSSSTLRLLHWNVHHGGVRTDGRLDVDGLVTWMVKFNAQVFSLNEVDTQAQADAIRSRLNAKTGITWRAVYSGRGNLILSRLPLSNQSVCTFNHSVGRKAAHAGVVVNGRAINIWSTHLSVDSGSERVAEVKAMKGCASQWAEARIVAGDYNMQASSSEYATMDSGYADAWKVAATRINYPGNCDGCTRKSRIDYVFSSDGASFLRVKSAQIYDTRDSNGVMPSDHKPLMVVYEVR